MAHFAELDAGNVVTRVLVVNNEVLSDGGTESEGKGVEFLKGLFGHGRWKQTSYNHQFRGRFAGIGDRYDEATDAFVD